MPKQKRPASSAIMTDKVTELILHDIQTGLLAPGAWLKQIDLEQRYRCGRPEVRRALDRLAQKRLVAHVPNRGYHVYRPDGRQEGEVAEIRILLETGVAGRIVTAATATDIALLERLAAEFARLMADGTTLELYEANLAFHHHLLSLCGNQELVALVAEIRQRTSAAPVHQWTTRARIAQSAREHDEMIDAVRQGDGERLRTVMTRHIRQQDR
ncbi:GntR family transcriptional regulator [Sodalis praecaptivus]|uniref:GntR family transcriptional regulator n=2 Tax=Sodalis praecaptivus TaxID=1239307 RepID=W0HTX0_9GAMM|nr:GntR family transcriptional regulator [Sodalis praecaptivus]AHF75952.1 GntR family transcriptional regulator [Sodalis praecaptivus]